MPKKKTSSSSKKTKTTTPVVQQKVVATESVVPVQKAVTEVPPTLQDQFTGLLAQLTALRSQLTSVTSQVRALSKRSERELKLAEKNSKKSKGKGNRKPSGFVKPTRISVELANFLGKPKGTEMARTEVTREINQYIKSNDLQDKKNGRRILADTKLRKLLKLNKNDELTYFNLQKYMSPHFAKQKPKTSSA
jgi:chromatin remodeling complex protein RSC6